MASEPDSIPHGNSDSPVIRWFDAGAVKKGEDFRLTEPECRHGNIPYSVFSVFDGHGGASAALYAKRQLHNQVMQHITAVASLGDVADDPQKFIDSLPTAMAEGFLLSHNAYSKKGEASGCTVTMAVIVGWVVTVASVGDSRAILGTREGEREREPGCLPLSADHRVDTSEAERARIVKEGGEISRMKSPTGVQTGPLRSWPGGLSVSRSIGDIDCGRQITPLPHVFQVEVPRSGGRIIIASDGLWDAMSFQKSLSLTLSLPPSAAAALLVKEAEKWKGLHDDVTVVVVDLLPSDAAKNDSLASPLSRDKTNFWKKMTASLKDKGNHNKSTEDSLSSSKTPKVLLNKDFINDISFVQKSREGSAPKTETKKNVCKDCGMQLVLNIPNQMCFCPPKKP